MSCQFRIINKKYMHRNYCVTFTLRILNYARRANRFFLFCYVAMLLVLTCISHNDLLKMLFWLGKKLLNMGTWVSMSMSE